MEPFPAGHRAREIPRNALPRPRPHHEQEASPVGEVRRQERDHLARRCRGAGDDVVVRGKGEPLPLLRPPLDDVDVRKPQQSPDPGEKRALFHGGLQNGYAGPREIQGQWNAGVPGAGTEIEDAAGERREPQEQERVRHVFHRHFDRVGDGGQADRPVPPEHLVGVERKQLGRPGEGRDPRLGEDLPQQAGGDVPPSPPLTTAAPAECSTWNILRNLLYDG